MKAKVFDNAKLGLFVILSLAFLIFSLYMIGRNRNLFGATFTVKASFYNVNGLVPGNNVRYAGIDVGTVRKIEIETDTSILVTMVIDKKARAYLRKNALASVGTDGLMGNKLININAQAGPSDPLEAGDRLLSLKPIETDEMLRTLNATNENFEIISTDLKRITQRINSSSSLWKLLSDTVITHDLRQAVANIKIAGQKASLAGDEIIDLASHAKDGRGLVGTLVMDTMLVSQIKSSISEIHRASVQTASAAKDFNDLISKVKGGQGTAGTLLTDTTLIHKLNVSLDNIEEGTSRFSENMKAMREHFLFKGYFKKQEKNATKE